MKKIYFISFFVVFLFSSLTFAETGKVLTEQLDMGLVNNNQINKVMFKFCNYGLQSNQLTSSLDLLMRPNQKKDVCVVLENNASTPLRIVAHVVPGTLNANGNMVCSNDGVLTGTITLADDSDISGAIVLDPHQQVIKHFTLASSKVASGKNYGCFAINLQDTQKASSNSMFNLVIRKAGNITVAVVGQPYHFQWFDDSLSWLVKKTRTVAMIGIVVCAVLLIYSLIPMNRSKKHSESKKTSHKK